MAVWVGGRSSRETSSDGRQQQWVSGLAPLDEGGGLTALHHVGFDTVHESRKRRPGLDHVNRGGRRHSAMQVGGSCPKRIGQVSQDTHDLSVLLLFEAHDLIVDLDGAQRLEEEARAGSRAAVHNPRNRTPVRGFDDQHESTVTLGDDLFLQIFRRASATQIRIEGASQAFPLATRVFTNRLELGGRVVNHTVGPVYGGANCRNLAVKRTIVRENLV